MQHIVTPYNSIWPYPSLWKPQDPKVHSRCVVELMHPPSDESPSTGLV